MKREYYKAGGDFDWKDVVQSMHMSKKKYFSSDVILCDTMNDQTLLEDYGVLATCKL